MRLSVAGLKAAGAVIIGKTTTTEFGWKSPGDCPLHGITRNPWNPRSHAGRVVVRRGRGGGGGVRAVAYRHRCRRLGPHPRGLVRRGRAEADATAGCRNGRAGAFAQRRGAPGPMTRTVRDTALMLSALARLRSARSVLPARRSARLARRDRGRGRGHARRRAAAARLRCAGGDGTASRRWSAPRRSWWTAGAEVEEADAGPAGYQRLIFGRVWGAALARLVTSFRRTAAALLDPGSAGGGGGERGGCRPSR